MYTQDDLNNVHNYIKEITTIYPDIPVIALVGVLELVKSKLLGNHNAYLWTMWC